MFYKSLLHESKKWAFQGKDANVCKRSASFIPSPIEVPPRVGMIVLGKHGATGRMARRHYWWMVDKVRARDGQCKLAPDLEPSPFYTKPSRPCAKDDDGVEKYNILRTCKASSGYRLHPRRSCIPLRTLDQSNQY